MMIFCNFFRINRGENPHVNSEVQKKERCVESGNVREVNLEKKRKSVMECYHIVKAEFFYYHSPRNTALGSPCPIDIEKTKKSQRAPPYNSK